MRISDWSSDVCSSDLNIQHHTGWDFAVNAPKSVSIMALVAGDDRIIEAHEQAVSVALAYLEEHATMRHRIDGEVTEKTTGRLIWARFTEHASRALDPHQIGRAHVRPPVTNAQPVCRPLLEKKHTTAQI